MTTKQKAPPMPMLQQSEMLAVSTSLNDALAALKSAMAMNARDLSPHVAALQAIADSLTTKLMPPEGE